MEFRQGQYYILTIMPARFEYLARKNHAKRKAIDNQKVLILDLQFERYLVFFLNKIVISIIIISNYIITIISR